MTTRVRVRVRVRVWVRVWVRVRDRVATWSRMRTWSIRLTAFAATSDVR